MNWLINCLNILQKKRMESKNEVKKLILKNVHAIISMIWLKMKILIFIIF